jgi:hypothetical protein
VLLDGLLDDVQRVARHKVQVHPNPGDREGRIASVTPASPKCAIQAACSALVLHTWLPLVG